MIIRISIDSKSIESNVIEIQSRSMSDPTLSDSDFEIKWLGSLPLKIPNRTNSPNNNCPAFGEPCLECENSSSLHLLTRFSEAHSISSVVYIASSCLFNTQL